MKTIANHSPAEIANIAKANDELRRSLAHGVSWVMITPAVAELIGNTTKFRRWHSRANLLRLISEYDSFGEQNDPTGEHNLGVVNWEGHVILWKIDYFPVERDGGFVFGVADGLAERVLSIMLATEY